METFMGRTIHHSKPAPTGVLAPQQPILPMGGIAPPIANPMGVAPPVTAPLGAQAPMMQPGASMGQAPSVMNTKF